MKTVNNFAGLNGFVWWVGVVENTADRSGFGRCQVRIFGWHTQDKNLIPTLDLPWAHPLLPLNSSNTTAAPAIGSWVLGFFLDGENGQQPVMMGVLPGLTQPTA